MIDKKKVVVMTKMASYEQKEGKKDISISRYFRSDYVGLQMLKGMLSGTISFLIMGLLVVIHDVELLANDLNQIDLVAVAKKGIVYYVIFILVYLLICYMIAALRYKRAQKNVRRHYQNLKGLSKYYE